MLIRRRLRRASKPLVSDAVKMNEAIDFLKANWNFARWFPTLDIETLILGGMPDSSLLNNEDRSTQGGKTLFLSDGRNYYINLVQCRSGKAKRKVVSSFDGECIVLVDNTSDGLSMKLLVDELINGKPHSISAGCTVQQLLTSLTLNLDGIAVAVDQQVVPRSEHEHTELKSGVTVEIIRAVGGG